MYAEMLGQIHKSGLYKSRRDRDGFQEVNSDYNLYLSQSFIFHARHTTFYIFYAKFPDQYLKDIAKYGAEYKKHVPIPDEIIIQQSRPFRMRVPKHQADFFRLLSKVLYYIVSGNSRVGVLAAQPWNKYFVLEKGGEMPEEIGTNADEADEGRRQPEACKVIVAANFRLDQCTIALRLDHTGRSKSL